MWPRLIRLQPEVKEYDPSKELQEEVITVTPVAVDTETLSEIDEVKFWLTERGVNCGRLGLVKLKALKAKTIEDEDTRTEE